MKIAGVKAVRDPPVGLVQHSGRSPLPVDGHKLPLIRARFRASQRHATHVTP
jgi:hypothetical protein